MSSIIILSTLKVEGLGLECHGAHLVVSIVCDYLEVALWGILVTSLYLSCQCHSNSYPSFPGPNSHWDVITTFVCLCVLQITSGGIIMLLDTAESHDGPEQLIEPLKGNNCWGGTQPSPPLPPSVRSIRLISLNNCGQQIGERKM